MTRCLPCLGCAHQQRWVRSRWLPEYHTYIYLHLAIWSFPGRFRRVPDAASRRPALPGALSLLALMRT